MLGSWFSGFDTEGASRAQCSAEFEERDWKVEFCGHGGFRVEV